MDPEKIKVTSIIIPNWNGLNLLRNSIYTIKKYTIVPYEIIVVDNNSTDNSVSFLKSQNIKVIENQNNLGFSKAINQGIKISKGFYILWLNNDTIIKSYKWIEKLIKTFKINLQIGAVGPLGGILDSNNLSHIGRQNPFYSGEVDYIEGWCLLTNKEVISKVGLLDESFFMFSEDADWCLRAKEKGYKILQVSNIPIIHLGSVTVKTQVPYNKNASFNYMKVSEKSEQILREKWKNKIKIDTPKIPSFKDQERVLIIRLHANGDILNTTPAIKQFKLENPKVFIGFLCLEECREIVENNQYIDKIYSIRKNIIPIDIYKYTWHKIYDLSDARYNIIDKLVQKFKVNGSKYKKGHPLMESQNIKIRKKRGEVKKKYTDIFADILEVKLKDRRVIFNTSNKDRIIANNILPITNLKKILLSLDSGWPTRNYPYVYLEKLIDILSKNYFVVLIGLNRNLNFKPRKNFLNLIGRTSNIGIGVELLKKMDLFIGIDSLFIHFAAMLNIPTISLWNVTEPNHVIATFPDIFVSLKSNTPCGPCYLVECNQQGSLKYICYKQLFPQKIVNKVKDVLRS